MGVRIPLDLIGEAYADDTLSWADQESINCFPVLSEAPGARSAIAQKGTPGLRSFGTVGTGGNRGAIKMRGVAYHVMDTGLYSVDAAGTGTLLGTIEGTGRVGMAQNGTQLVIVNGSGATGKGYVYNIGTLVFAEITDADFLKADDVFFIGNYFFFINQTVDEAFISALGDGTAYDALDFITAENSPDGLVGGIELNGDALLMGEETIEVWAFTGAALFPFERRTTISRGLAATFAKAKLDNTVYWLGDNAVAYRLEGYTPRRVSKGPIEKALSEETVSEAFAMAYEAEGHAFFMVTLGKTWAWDVASRHMAHRRKSFEMDRWRGNTILYCYGKYLVGDSTAGTVWEMTRDVYAEGNAPLVWERKTQVVHANGEYIRALELELEFDMGQGLTTGQGSDPTVDMCYSDDGGRTFCDWRQRSLGKIGQYRNRVRFHGLGRFRQRMFWIRVADAVKRDLLAASGRAFG